MRYLIFLSDDIKQDTTTTAEHSKFIIELFQNRIVLFMTWVLYGEIILVLRINISVLLRYIYYQIFSHAYNIIINRVVRAPVHGKEFFDGLNATQKNVYFNVHCNCTAAWCNTLWITDVNVYHNCKHVHHYSKVISKKIFQTQHGNMDCCIMVRIENMPIKVSGLIVSIISKK